MVPTKSRKYDFVLLGATGFTGKLCAEYVTQHLPTNISWAIAGRSQSKLSSLLDDLNVLNTDRKQPDIEVVDLNPADLERLAKTTTIILNTVGPYHLYSSPVVAACAQNGTHYLDVTGESPWVLDMIRAYHDQAKKSHAILIPQTGIESAPSDLLVWSLVERLRQENPKTVGIKGVGEVIGVVQEFKGTPSGGTLATVLTMMDTYERDAIAKSTRWTHSPIPKTNLPQRSLFSRLWAGLLGVRSVSGLGTLTKSVNAGPNIATVQRTWGLLDNGKYYGSSFVYKEYATARNWFTAILNHWAIIIGSIILFSKPARWLLKKVVSQPGQGADREAQKSEALEQRALITVQGDDGKTKKAFARLRFEGGMYYFTGILLAEAAMCMLRDEKKMRELDGGLLTPACLGQTFIDRLKAAGAIIECEISS